MTNDLVFPKWKIPAGDRSGLSEEAYLAWLGEERARLIREGALEKLKGDVARKPVDVRFVWVGDEGRRVIG